MFKRYVPHVLQDQEGAAGSSGSAGSAGGAGAAPDAGTGAAGAGGNVGAAGAAGAGAGSVLASGAAGAGGGAAGAGGGAGVADPAADPHAWLPEKHRVFGQDGKTLDLEASARKVAEAYGHAEKRIGSGDVPPKDVAGYKINVPEALAEKIPADKLQENQGFKDFLGKAHAAGLTQKQVDVVVADFLERSLAIQGAMPQLAAADCEAQLRQTEGWNNDQAYKANISSAFRAGQQIFGKDFEGIAKDYGNDPRLIRGLATIGAEMTEDRSASPEAQAQVQENLDTLMASPAYLNGRHPEHSATLAKVDALTKRLVGERPVNGGKSMSFRT